MDTRTQWLPLFEQTANVSVPAATSQLLFTPGGLIFPVGQGDRVTARMMSSRVINADLVTNQQVDDIQLLFDFMDSAQVVIATLIAFQLSPSINPSLATVIWATQDASLPFEELELPLPGHFARQLANIRPRAGANVRNAAAAAHNYQINVGLALRIDHYE